MQEGVVTRYIIGTLGGKEGGEGAEGRITASQKERAASYSSPSYITGTGPGNEPTAVTCSSLNLLYRSTSVVYRQETPTLWRFMERDYKSIAEVYLDVDPIPTLRDFDGFISESARFTLRVGSLRLKAEAEANSNTNMIHIFCCCGVCGTIFAVYRTVKLEKITTT